MFASNDPKDNKTSIYPGGTRRDAVEMKRRGSFYRDFEGSREDQNLLAWFASSPRYSATDGRQK